MTAIISAPASIHRVLAAAQRSGDVLDANAVPMGAYVGSGYAATIEAERVGGQQAGWGA